jgi:hypothetical protein
LKGNAFNAQKSRNLVKGTCKSSKENIKKRQLWGWKKVVTQTKGNSRMQCTLYKGTHGNETI